MTNIFILSGIGRDLWKKEADTFARGGYKSFKGMILIIIVITVYHHLYLKYMCMQAHVL